MVFSSGVFLFIFLPVVLVAHTLINNNRIRNVLLIVASLVFYAYGEPVYILMLLASVGINCIFGRILAVNKNRGVLALAVILNIGLLVVYKYSGFLVGIINYIPGVELPVPAITMPIGISFFTFQAISFVIDTYRSEDRRTTGFFDVLLYISLFPQLIAGPIVKYNTIKDQISSRVVTVDGLAHGMRRFILGLAKKMLIANTMGYAADKVFAMTPASIDMPLAWLGGICYTLQIYFDFSGYSDMALGLGSMMGFDFPENFNHPYIASGIRDFWRRWHMSLTGWFREYLYIPLGGNRKGRTRQIFNSLIVFLCTGIWHGANFTFIVWGLFHGILMSAETLAVRKKDSRTFNPFKWLYTVFFVIIGFVIFRSDNMTYAFNYIGRMFSFTNGVSSYRNMMMLLTPSFIATLAISLVACTPVVQTVGGRLKGHRGYQVANLLCYLASFGLYLLCIMTLAADSYNPFIYFRF